MADEEKRHDPTRPIDGKAADGTQRIRRPFDTSGVNWEPEPEKDDPPYRDWWVIGNERDEEE